SPTLLGLPCHQAPQGGVRLRRMIERLQELLAVPIRQHDRCFFRETNLVLRDHARFADAELVLAHLLDDDCRIGERFGQADAALCVRRSRFQTHLCPFLSSAIEPIIHERGIAGKWEFPTSRTAAWPGAYRRGWKRLLLTCLRVLGLTPLVLTIIVPTIM